MKLGIPNHIEREKEIIHSVQDSIYFPGAGVKGQLSNLC